jgi:hypothetical protein
MALSRNFRTTYYKTLGVPVVQHIVDVDASFAALLGDRDASSSGAASDGAASAPSVNVPQLAKLALEVGVAPGFRALTWQLLTGALPALPAAWAFARGQRQEMLDDLMAAEAALRPADRDEQQSGEDSDDDLLGHDHRHNDPQTEAGAAVRIVRLHRFYWTQILERDASELWAARDAGAVARAVCDVLAGDAERFWCFSRALELLSDSIELLDPPLSSAAVRGMTTGEVEAVLLRVLDVKRRRAVETSSGPHRERL